MNRRTVLLLTSVVICLFFSIQASAHNIKFQSSKDTVEDIKRYYKKVMGTTVMKVHLLEIVEAQDDSNLFYVYFLEDEEPILQRDVDGNIDASGSKVMRATYHYSYLKNKWRIKSIEKYKGTIIFNDNN